jgi:hypothetical protein
MTKGKKGSLIIKIDITPESLALIDESAKYYFGNRGRASLLRHIIDDWNAFWIAKRDGELDDGETPPLPEWCGDHRKLDGGQG